MAKILSVIVAALALAPVLGGCCATGSGCAPAASSGQINSQVNWDGLNDVPDRQTSDRQPTGTTTPVRRTASVPRDKPVATDVQSKPAAASSDATAPAPKAFSPEWQNQERDDDAKVTRSMKICRDC